MAAEFHSLKVADIRRETPDAVSIAFAVPPELAQAYRFAPGQHLTVRAAIEGAECRRSYSICTGLDDGELRVAVKKVDGGLFSAHANDRINVGDAIDVMTPQGRFGAALEHDPEKWEPVFGQGSCLNKEHDPEKWEPVFGQGSCSNKEPGAAYTYLAIAAGSGITPIMSLIRTVLAREPASRFVLIYGNRTAASIIFKEALEDLKDRYLDRLALHHVLSREQQDVALLNGRIDAQKIAAVLASAGGAAGIDHAFLCGPGGLIEDFKAALARLGMRPDRIHVEYFTTDEVPGAPRPIRIEPTAAQEPIATARLTLYGSAYDVPVYDGETIVDAGLRVGLEMPYSCRGGMCCTCRAKLVAGDVRMDRNYSLEGWEMAAGYVLTCQSHPLTKEVVLDYDQL